jgi:hypothetical protein
VDGRKDVRLGALALMSVALGCGRPSNEGDDLPVISSGMADGVFEDTGATSIEFRAGAELPLVAGQTASLSVQVSPPGRHQVRFALLGQVSDAFLSDDLVPTLDDGVAETSITVLAASSSFTVRAASGEVFATLRVTTQEANEASLIIVPEYGYNRPVESWVASVHVDQTCARLRGIPYPDGPVMASSSSGPVVIERVPADVSLAAVLRAGQFAGGCQSVAPLRANTQTSINIIVMDRPMQTVGMTFQLAFGVEPTPAINPALDELAFRAVRALVGTASDDLAALLDAMSALSSDVPAFAEARAEQGWRAALVESLAAELPGTGLRTMVQDWMRTGLERLEEPGAFLGTLTSLRANGDASLELESVIGLAVGETGFERENTASVLAETEDVLRVGATLTWRPSPLLAAAANLAALDRDPARSSAADAMATQFGCANVADVLAAAGSSPGQAFAGCDEACVLELCRGAMRDLWLRVAESDLPAVPWQISGASRAQIDESARPISVAGSWIGSLTVSDFGVTSIQGPFSGQSGSD